MKDQIQKKKEAAFDRHKQIEKADEEFNKSDLEDEYEDCGENYEIEYDYNSIEEDKNVKDNAAPSGSEFEKESEVISTDKNNLNSVATSTSHLNETKHDGKQYINLLHFI